MLLNVDEELNIGFVNGIILIRVLSVTNNVAEFIVSGIKIVKSATTGEDSIFIGEGGSVLSIYLDENRNTILKNNHNKNISISYLIISL